MNEFFNLQAILYGAILVLAVGNVFTFIRFVKGPTLPDRIIAFDLMATLAIGILVLFSIIVGQPLFLDVALAMALVVFLGTVALARYLQENAKR